MFVVVGGVAGVWEGGGGGGGGGGIVVAKGDTAEISPTYPHSVLSHTQIQMDSNENREAGNSLVINKVTIKLKWRGTRKFGVHELRKFSRNQNFVSNVETVFFVILFE